MRTLLNRHIMSEMAARRFAWGASFGIATVCTTLVLKMLPDFNVWGSIGLVCCIASAWVVLGAELAKIARA